MRYINRRVMTLTGLTLPGVILALSCTSASGAPTWKLNGSEIKVALSVKVKSGTTSTFKDANAGIGVECGQPGKYTVGPGRLSETTALNSGPCSFKSKENSSCETTAPVTVTMLGLPWTTELFEEGASIKAHIKGAGKVGFTIECRIFKVFTIHDECTGLSNAIISNAKEGVGVVLFETKLSCSIGGSGSGSIFSLELLESPEGSELAVG
jgi:hypothetical protein